MAISPATADQPYSQLVAYLFTRREAILNNWRSACEQDPALNKISMLSREEFNNLLPLILDSLEQRLLKQPPSVDPNQTAQAHGLHRWHNAHALVETTRELNHLTHALYDELALFNQLFADQDVSLLLAAHRQVAQLMEETMDGSLAKYDELQHLQAANRLATLQRAVEQMETLASQRTDMLRTSTHDLRGSFSIIHSATQLLQMDAMSETERAQFLTMLDRNLGAVRTLLGNLMDLSRLEAGQETVQLKTVDAASLLNGIVEAAQPMATERGIVLQANGPDQLAVTTDRVKLQRIAQNLLLNALKYTVSTPDRPGMVSVSWSQEGDYRWIFSVQDSGPGLPKGTQEVLGQQLRPTVESTGVLSADQSEPVLVAPEKSPSTDEPDQSSKTKTEGVGLQIVKRLCELLEASLDVESQAGRGTLFRVRLPIHTEQSPEQA